MSKLFLLLIVSSFILSGHCACNSTNVFQWFCFTTQFQTTVQQAAAQFNVHPNRLCDYNKIELKSCGTIPAGFDLRIPNNTFSPKLGSYDFYIVQKGDTLQSIVQGNVAKVRDLSLFLSYNEDLLWGTTEVAFNMTLRIPAPYCVPDLQNNLDCHNVTYGQTLNSIAQLYNTTVEFLQKSNQKTLGGQDSLNSGMRLLVPIYIPAPQQPCVENSFYGCYTVQPGDSLFTLSQSLRNDPYKICEINNLADCELLFAGQVLSYQKLSCVDNDQYVCFTVPATKQNKSDNDPYVLSSLSEYSSNSPYLGFDDSYKQLLRAFNLHMIGNYSCNNKQIYHDGDCVVHAGMQIRLPYKYCVPNLNQTCHLVTKYNVDQYPGITYQLGTDLQFDQYDTTMNQIYYYHINMDYRIFRPLVSDVNWDLTDCRDTPNVHICYKLQYGDYASLVAQNFNIQTDLLCQYNNIRNCSDIKYDRALMIPINQQRVDLVELKKDFLSKQIITE